jgi:hypothetical protein
MRLLVLALAATSILLFAATSAQAGSSCSTFAKIKTFDNDAQAITIEKEKGSEQKYFPKTEGAPTTSKIPAGCKSKVLSQDSFPVKSTGGRLAITQIRENFSGKMLNDVNDPAWLANKLTEIIESGEMVLVVVRQPPGSAKNAPYGVTTIYMPITPAEEAEIARLNAQASDD